jgi:hypothetical protein
MPTLPAISTHNRCACRSMDDRQPTTRVEQNWDVGQAPTSGRQAQYLPECLITHKQTICNHY